jgi:alanine racemase
MSIPPAPGALSSWLTLSASAFGANVEVFRAQVGSARRLGAVLKGNAYGHGFWEILALAHPRVDVLYVMTPGEALAIRGWEKRTAAPAREVLVMGATAPEECVTLAEAGVSVVVGDAGFAAVATLLRARSLRLGVHLHLDTGLSREGFTSEQLASGAADFLSAASDVVKCTGVLSHFANTEDVTEQQYADDQLAVFHAGVRELHRRGLAGESLVRHFAASAAALVLPAARLDVVRVGIGLYGLWPSAETRLSARVVGGSVPLLEPVLSWQAPSQVVKMIRAGSFVGYGCTYRCGWDTRVAVLPVGYWDGYPRLASGKAHVLVSGKRCPVIGRVMMNHLIVDVTQATTSDAPLVATLIGTDGDEAIPVEMLAGWGQTIHYEIVTRLGAHLRRVVR